jgi:hypothetical protein
MAKNTTSIPLPEALIGALDRKAAAQGLTAGQVIIQAVERALTDQSAWSPGFIEAIGSRRPELEEAVDTVMSAIRERRSRNDAPAL